jgi:hypothetical protein
VLYDLIFPEESPPLRKINYWLTPSVRLRRWLYDDDADSATADGKRMPTEQISIETLSTFDGGGGGNSISINSVESGRSSLIRRNNSSQALNTDENKPLLS